MESRDPGKQKTGRAQKLTEDTCGYQYKRSLACKCHVPIIEEHFLSLKSTSHMTTGCFGHLVQAWTGTGTIKANVKRNLNCTSSAKSHEVRDLVQPAWTLLSLSFLHNEAPSVTPPALLQ